MYCYNCMKETVDGASFCSNCGQNPRKENLAHQLQSGTQLYNRYLVGNVLGEGGFGITYIGFDQKLEMRVAIKEFYPNGFANRNNTVTNNVTLNVSKDITYFDNAKDKYLKEAQSIARFSEEQGIVDVRDYFEENNTAYIIMEYLEGRDLARKLKEDGLFDSVALFKQMIPVMYSLSRVHKEKVIHRDIAPDNIKMTGDGSFKLMDFGAARFYAGDNKKTMSITLKQGFTPIEQYSNGEQGPWTDVYGLCATIYKCITGKTPVDALSRIYNDTLKKPSELGIKIPQSLENVLMYGLAIYPDNRCKNMEELMSLTDRALRNEQVLVGSASNMDRSVRQVKNQDDEYKTMFADNAQRGSGQNGGQARQGGQGYNQGQNYSGQGYSGQKSGSQKSGGKKSGGKKSDSNGAVKLLAGLFIALLLVLVIVIGVMFIGKSGGSSKKTDSDRKVEETKKSDSEDSKSEEKKDAEEEKEAEEEAEEEEYQVEVPDVAGMKADEATTKLKNAGLKVETQEQESETVAEGYVIGQSVNAGKKLDPGETVLLYVSKGMEAPKGLSITDSSSNSTATTFTAPKGNTPKDGDILYCCARDYVSLRTGPSTSATEILRIPCRESMVCRGIADNYQFYYVEYTTGGKTYEGYASTKWTSTNPNEPFEW